MSILRRLFTHTSYRWIFFISFFVLLYYRSLDIFFIQDEWQGFGIIIGYGKDLIFHRFALGDVNHLVPLGSALSHVTSNLFVLNYKAYNLVGTLIHFINAALVYKLGKIITKSEYYGFIAAFVFASTSVATEFVFWPKISMNMLSLTFVLLSLLVLTKLRKHLDLGVNSFLLALLITLSMLVLEYGAGMFLFIPFSILLFSKFRVTKTAILTLIPLIVFAGLYTFFRFYNIPSSGASYDDMSYSLISKLAAALQFPFKYIGQIYFWSPIMNFINLFSPLERTWGVKVGSIISIISGIMISISLFFLVIKERAKKNYYFSENIIIFYGFLVASALPFLLIPESLGAPSLFSSRHLYFGTVAASITMASLTKFFASGVSESTRRKWTILLGIFVLLGIGGNVERQNRLLEVGNVRRHILGMIRQDNPRLPSKVLFYTQSDTAYYGLPDGEETLPFQSGLGQTLMVWYQDSNNLPKEFFQNRFLWEITDEGYQERDGIGFGYFRNYELLKDTLISYNVPIENVIAYSWKDESGVLQDISTEVRFRLESDLNETNK